MKTFAEYQAEALALSDYPRAGDRKTNARLADALNGEFAAPGEPSWEGETLINLECAVLGRSRPGGFASLPVYPAMAMCGEAGEFAEKIKKAWRDETPLDCVGAAKELGDVLWYVAAAARDLGFTLEEVAQLNIEKLHSRRARGTLAGAGDDR